MADKFTLSGKLEDLVGDFDPSDILHAYVECSEIMTTDTSVGGGTRIGAIHVVTIDPEAGTWSAPNLPSSADVAYVPGGHLFKLVVKYRRKPGGEGRGAESNWFEVTANVDFKDVDQRTPRMVDAVVVTNILEARDQTLAARDETVEISGIDDVDGALDFLMPTKLATPGDPVADALSTTYAARWFNPSQVAADTAAKIAGKTVLVIFRHDDIQPSALEYLPAYEAHGMKASWYPCPNLLGTSAVGSPTGHPFITAAQLDGIFAAGHEIGSHTNNHAYFITESLTEAQRREEMRSAKAWLEDRYGDTGYTCDTFALPGNQIVDSEVLDYHFASLSDGPDFHVLSGVQQFVSWRNGYYYNWLDYTGAVRNPGATLATDRAAVQAQIAEMDAAGGAIAVIQAHNTTELTVAQHAMMLEEFAADSRVAVLTTREWVHYCRHTRITVDGGRNYHPARNAQTLGRTTGPISATSLTLTGDMTMETQGNSIYFKVAGVNQFRVYQSASGYLRVRDLVNNRDVGSFRTSAAGGGVPTFYTDIAQIANGIILTSTGVAQPANIIFGSGVPTAALGAIYKGSIYIQGDGDPDSCVWIKTAGGTTGWKLLGQHETTRTSTQILSAADTINTQAKVQGRRIYDTTLNKPLWATGSGATATWVDATGTVVHTPV